MINFMMTKAVMIELIILLQTQSDSRTSLRSQRKLAAEIPASYSAIVK